MKNTLNSVFSILIFGIGFVLGAHLVKKRCQSLANQEIEEIRSFYLKRNSTDNNDKRKKAEKPSETVNNIISREGYRSNEKRSLNSACGKPYVISPAEFGENDDYNCISLTYYSDGVIADEFDNKIEDVDDTVGADAVNHFGEYEDDSVFVRNDDLKIDYEILLDHRQYSKVVKNQLYRLEE